MKRGTPHWQSIITWFLFVTQFPSSLLFIPHLSLQFLLWNNSNLQSLWSFSQLLFSIKISKNIKTAVLKLTPKCFHFTTVRQKKKERNLSGLHSSEIPFLTSWEKAIFVLFFSISLYLEGFYSMNMKHSLKARKQRFWKCFCSMQLH